jgi:glycerophosphoryl diester phosphodiesterase
MLNPPNQFRSRLSIQAAMTTLVLLFLSWLAPLLIGSPNTWAAKGGVLSKEGGRPLIIAHRGGAKESTENTIAAFQRAIRIGADGIETDIRMTRDGIIVVYHDEYFGRVEGLGEAHRTRLVSDLRYSELTAQTLLPVGDDTGGRRVPTLTELLGQLNTGLLNIEIKRSARFDEMLGKTFAILRNSPALERVVLEVPDFETAQKARAAVGARLKLHINPDYDESAVFENSVKRVLDFKPHSISVSYKKISMELVERAHQSGAEVWVWTVDTTEMARAMAVLGADAIKTDRPAALVQLFRGRTKE